MMTSEHRYDVLVVGAGPAGLSAARTAARLGFDTLVVERATASEDLAHTGHAIIVPVPELVSGRPLLGGMFYPQVDLWIPDDLIVARDVARRCLSPSGAEFLTVSPDSPREPSVMIDKAGLLRLMTGQAASTGAQFRFGTEAIDLLRAGGRVDGVQTTDGEIRADMVILAEGAMGGLCERTGFYPSAPRLKTRMVISSMELEAPAVGRQHLGEIVTLGGADAPSHQGAVSLVAPATGKAQVTIMNLADELSCAAADAAMASFEQYQRDPRVADLLVGARVVRQSSYMVPFRDAPDSVVGDGIIAVGDTIAPNGRMGILESIYLGRHAALFAAASLDLENPSGVDLEAFNEIVHATILPALEAEARTTVSLMQMSNHELERLCAALNGLHLPVPFLGNRPKVEWSTVNWLLRQLPMADSDYALVQRAFGVDASPRTVPDRRGMDARREAELLAR